ncbi:DUF2971 domain-containing protein [Bradyrhizobium liaoningense]
MGVSKDLRGSRTATDESQTEMIAKAHPELHHYTTEAGLKGIVEFNSFRASFFSDLNDAHEIRELQNPLVIELASRLTPIIGGLRISKPKDHPVWRSGAPQSLAQSWASILYKIIFANDDSTRKGYCCTTSFCSHAKDQTYERENGLLSQWRGYGGQDGYCLVFDTAALLKLFEREKSENFYVYTDVLEAHYPRDDAKPLESFAKLLDESAAIYESALAGNRDFVVDPVLLPFLASAIAYKHRAFYEEREVRLVAMAGTALAAEEMKKIPGFVLKPLKNVLKFSKGAREQRYISLFGKQTDSLPLRRVIVGPSRSQQDNVSKARQLVGGIPVFKSATPYSG